MFIDLHCHILPGVDDGAPCLDDAVQMLRQAAASGVEHLVATPHHNYFGHDCAQPVAEAFRQLLDCVDDEQLSLELSIGRELLAGPDLLEQLEHGLTYGESPWFLVEFLPRESPRNMNRWLDMAADRGFLPVIAHPERYFALRDEPIIARRWIKKGWIVQVNRDSLLGAFGDHSMACADFLLQRDWANCIASDAHGCRERSCNWQQVLEKLAQRYPRDLLYYCLEAIPGRIINHTKTTGGI